jgi:hypothetical protein
MGDEVSEDLFILAYDTGLSNLQVLITPVDFRVKSLPESASVSLPSWTSKLYQGISDAVEALPSPTLSAPDSRPIPVP